MQRWVRKIRGPAHCGISSVYDEGNVLLPGMLMWWPLWLSLTLFGISAVFLIIGDVRKGASGVSSFVPLELQAGILRLVSSDTWVWMMGNVINDNSDEIIGDSCSGTAGRLIRDAPNDEPSRDEVASNSNLLVEEGSRFPSMSLNINRRVRSINMRDLKLGMEKGGVNHDSLQQIFKSRSKKRLPYMVKELLSQKTSESERRTWNWDITSHARKWPVLENVRELPYSKDSGDGSVAAMYGHVFVDEEHDPSLLTFQAPTVRQRPAASRISLVREMLTLDFLSQNEEVKGGTRGHYHYDCNYRVYEGIVGGRKDSNLLSSDDSFSWKSFSFSDVSSNVTQQLSERGVDLSVAQSPSMWLLPEGTALQLRYAESHRTRLQLVGRANYTLFPPSALPSLSLYPSGHAARWQSQVQLYDPEPSSQQSNFPQFHSWLQRSQGSQSVHEKASNKTTDGDAVMRATLEEGDVLYIPPFWSVHSEAVSGLSSVLDVPSHSTEQMALMEAWHMRLPLQEPALYRGTGKGTEEHDQGQVVEISFLDRVVAAKVYIVHILSRCPSLQRHIKSPAHLARHLYHSRYSSLYAPKSLFMKPYRSFVEGSDSGAGSEAESQRSGFQCFDERKEEVDASVRKLDSHYLASRADFVASSVEDPAVPLGAKVTWVESYVERVAAWAMAAGSSRSSPSMASNRHEDGLKFILSCLQIDKYVEVELEEEGGAILLDTNQDNHTQQ